MMSKHTPGPFEAVEGSSFWTIETADGQRLANTLDSEMIFIGSDEFNHSEANAKLFAAAPDLLDALLMAEEILARLEPIVDRGEDDSISVEAELIFARAAIAKAQGEQQ